jgi:hypothetical protein
MKWLLAIAIGLGSAVSATAQNGHTVAVYRPVYVYRPLFGIGYYAPFYGYYAMPYGMYPYGSQPYVSRLDKEEADIRSDYNDRIYSVKHDSSLTTQQKRTTIKALKKERKQDIKDLVANYHKQAKNDNSAREQQSGL